ncbi:hypothetical protein CERZMDRAFT_89876 [Cercospora zeae-maydis SCOH1-5]|uniref:Uncharacterized protein n=1 Tax=Cercospora zeae-maydis SCOH1-5 TaxID=717836 RepID=A0A6A6FSD3_9PEZI|nr:hypothetical protein CERZMDRAFT_89876 [Cercospora zeae-maydis SCOH1-5]
MILTRQLATCTTPPISYSRIKTPIMPMTTIPISDPTDIFPHAYMSSNTAMLPNFPRRSIAQKTFSFSFCIPSRSDPTPRRNLCPRNPFSQSQNMYM